MLNDERKDSAAQRPVADNEQQEWTVRYCVQRPVFEGIGMECCLLAEDDEPDYRLMVNDFSQYSWPHHLASGHSPR